MDLSEHIVQIGACGWQYDAWQGEFYPEDLPDEWQIGYYGNEFQVVLIPSDYWLAGPEAIETWLEESDESLNFICEWPAGAKQTLIAQAKQGIEILSDRVLGILIPLNSKVDEAELVIYKELAKQYPICFDIAEQQRDVILPWLEQVLDENEISLCWRGEPANKQDLAIGPIGITRIDGEPDPKALRNLMETLVAASQADRHMVLIVDGKPPSMQTLTNAGIILDLL